VENEKRGNLYTQNFGVANLGKEATWKNLGLWLRASSNNNIE
jgi:hypothetical protein